MRSTVILLLALACTAVAAAASPPKARVAVRSTSLGSVLVDSRGHTLYAFDLDKRGKSTCTGACAANWPPLLTSGKPLAAGVPATRVGVLKRPDGKLQVTFMGHPLYVFAADRHAGDVAGAAIAHWAALAPSGARLRASAGSSTTPTTTPTGTVPDYGGGNGY